MDATTEEFRSDHVDHEYAGSAIELADIEQGMTVMNNDVTENTKKEKRATYSAVVETIVPLKRRQYFVEEWCSLIYNRVSTYKGFRTRHVHLVNEQHGFLEYITVLVFDDYESFNVWQLSDDRKQLVDMLKRKGITAMFVNAYGGCSSSAQAINADGSVGSIAGGSTSCVSEGTGRVVKQNSLTGKIPRPMPPPKWKLMVILLVAVYASTVVLGEGSLSIALLKADQPSGFTALVGVVVIVCGMTYSFLPLFMSIPLVNKWLRRPRSIPVEDMHPLHSLLDQGLLIFAEETHEPKVPQELLERVSKLEVRCDKLRSANHHLREQVTALQNNSSCGDGRVIANGSNSGGSMELGLRLKTVSPSPTVGPNPAVERVLQSNATAKSYKSNSNSNNNSRSGSPQSPPNKTNNPPAADLRRVLGTSTGGGDAATGTDSNVPITMAVRHYVKWECVPDFEKWTDEIDKEMSRHKGYLGMVKIDPTPGESVYINSFTFDTFDNLVAFTRSHCRDELLARLEPMLESTSAYQINEERYLGNTWSELFVSTGGTVPDRPPPLWKSCILIICPLFILVFQLGTPLAAYLAASNPPIDPYLAKFIGVAVIVPLMTYFGVPTMHMFFGKWLNMPRKKNIHYPHLAYFEFLDIGIPVYMQVVVLITFILTNVLSPDISL